MSVVIFKLHRKRVKIETSDIVLFEKVRAKFSTKNSSARFSKWASDIWCPITPLGSFKCGLFKDVVAKFKQLDPNCKIKIDPKLKHWIKPFSIKTKDIEFFHGGKFEEREYQTFIIKESLKNGRVIFESATGSGKSFIIYSILRNLRKIENKVERILVLVPSIQLVKQMYKDFQEYGAPKNFCQMFSGFDQDIDNSPVIISNRQWIQGHNQELPKIDALIVDECQQLASDNKITKWIDKLDTQIRFGCSGTIPKDPIKRLGIIGTIGPLIYSVKSHKMQKEGFISNINIKSFRFEHRPKPYWPITDENYDKMHWIEYDWIETNQKVLQFITIFMTKLKENSVILFDHTKHGESLFQMIKEKHKGTVRFINGEVPLDEREKTRKLMEKKNNVILVANCKAAGVGLNVKNIHNIVFAMNGMAETKIIQAIGRGVRLHQSKDHLTLYDFHHNLKYSIRHFKERVKLYKEHYKIDIKKSKSIII